jgi:hypothetical protein
VHLNVNPKGLVAIGAVLAGALVLSFVFTTAPGAVASAGANPTTTSTTAPPTTTTAPPSPPQFVTTDFVCNGACAIGPGDVGMAFAAGLIGTGAVLATFTERTPVSGGDGSFGLTQHRQNAAGLNPLTVTDSLGSTITCWRSSSY